jgi:hypothetical protein
MNNLLVYSSTLFLIPSIYSFIKNLYLYCLVSFITSIVSIIYWINPINGLRRNIDLFISKISFFIYFISGCIYLKEIYLLFGIIGCILILLFYYLSCINYNSIWFIYHMLFHIFVVFIQMIILYKI